MQIASPALKEPQTRKLVIAGIVALLVGALFLLPHLVQIACIGDWESYSPFSAHSKSPMVWDETFLYGAEANYMLTHGGAPAYDDDWEHRLTPYPYSIIPTGLEALTAKTLGSLKLAHLVFKFVFPALTAFLLMLILGRAGSSSSLAALLAIAIIVLAFSPRTLLKSNIAFFLHNPAEGAVETLEASRTPNPNVTFPMMLLAAVCLAEAERKKIRRSRFYLAASAGLLGGLLFYSYIYYAIAWSAALLILSVVALLWPGVFSRNAWLALGVTGISATPFVIWKHVAEKSGNYAGRTARLGMVRGHMLNAEQLQLTLVWGVAALLLAAIAWKLLAKAQSQPAAKDPSCTRTLVLIFGALMAGGLIGLDMRLVLGFDVQSAHHFPHMVLQPIALLLASILLAQAVRGERELSSIYVTLTVLLIAAGAIAQVQVARSSAEMFRISPERRDLIRWLNTNTPTGSVVVSNELDLNMVLPVSTHNSVLVSNGSRSSATNHELVERYLLASRLTGTPAEQVRQQLLSGAGGEPGSFLSYSYYLFETSEYLAPGTLHIKPSIVPELLDWFSSMNLAEELRRFRADYVVTDGNIQPHQVPGMTSQKAFASGDLTVWQLR